MDTGAGDLDSHPLEFNPFPGLRPFEPDEDHLFFGRERETDELLRRLRTQRFVSVLGNSGSGKSSLVRSGLIPSLYSGIMVQAGSSWRVAIFRPGEDPIGNLAGALSRPDVLGRETDLGETERMILETTLRRSSLGLVDCARQAHLGKHENLLVVVDQFEELFRFKASRKEHGSRDEAVAFAKLLLGAAHQSEVPVYVVLTMRSDFIGDCMEYPGLPEAVNQGQYLIPRMTRDELRQAIAGPVAVGGGEISHRLVARLLNEVGDDPDQLPVLQHALMRTWDLWTGDHADGEPLDERHYEAIGTMTEALSRHGEEAFAELEEDRAREVAERLFKALTDKRQDNRGVRRPIAVSEVAAAAAVGESDVMRVVEVFRRPGRSFLMPPQTTALSGDSILDLSHESLMRNWTRLVEWVEEETASGKSYRHLCRAARRFDRGQGNLWVDPELALGLKWREESKPTEAWARRYDPDFQEAMRFLERSREAQEQARMAEEQERRAKLRRARILAGVLGSAALVTLVFGLLAVRAGLIARKAEQIAHKEAETATAVTGFLVRLFEVADPEEGLGTSVTAREILDQGAKRIDTELAGQPAVQARMKRTVGKVYQSLGLFDAAQPLLEEAVQTAEKTLGPKDPETMEARHRLAEVYWNRGRFAEAESLYRATAEARTRILGADNAATLESEAGLAQTYQSLGRFSEAEETARRVLADQRRVLGAEGKTTLKTLHLLGTSLQSLGRYPESETTFLEAWEAQKKTLGKESPDAMTSMGSLGELYSELGRFDAAESLYTESLESRRKVFGEDHPKTLSALSRLAILKQKRGLWGEAGQMLRTVLEKRRRVLGEEHPGTLESVRVLAWHYYLESRLEEAETLAREAFEKSRKTLGEENPDTRNCANTLAAVLDGQGRYSEVEPLYLQNLEIYKRLYGKAHPRTTVARNNLAVLYGHWGRTDQQEALCRENLDLNLAAYGKDHPRTLFYMNNLASVLTDQRRYAEAESLGLESLKRHRGLYGNDNPNTFGAMAVLINLYWSQRRFAETEKLLLERTDGFRRVFGENHPETADAMSWLSWFYQNQGRMPEGQALREKVLAAQQHTFGDEHPSTIDAYDSLAWFHQMQGHPQKALELRRKAMEFRRRLAEQNGAGPHDKNRYASALVDAKRELQNPAEAVRFARQACEMTSNKNREYLRILAEGLFRWGRTPEAIKVQEQALALIPKEDPDARNGYEYRLGEFYAASGDLGPKRRIEVAEIARNREVAEKPGASPRARQSYAWELLIADPPDLRDPRQALRVYLAINEETHYEQADLVAGMALAYHLAGEGSKAVQTQEKVLTLVPRDEIWNRQIQENRLLVYQGRGVKKTDLAAVLVGSWSATIGPVKARIEFQRNGNYMLGINKTELEWIPAEEIWLRYNVGTGDLEFQAADAGWTNLRYEKADYLVTDSGEMVLWSSKQWLVSRWTRELVP